MDTRITHTVALMFVLFSGGSLPANAADAVATPLNPVKGPQGLAILRPTQMFGELCDCYFDTDCIVAGVRSLSHRFSAGRSWKRV